MIAQSDWYNRLVKLVIRPAPKTAPAGPLASPLPLFPAEKEVRPDCGGREGKGHMIWLFEQFIRSRAKILTLTFFTYAALC